MNVKVSKTHFFIISTILFLPLIAMMITGFITVFVVVTLKYYPIDLNNPVVMNQYYSHLQESQNNTLKYKVLVLGLDGVQESSLNAKNTPDLMLQSENSQIANYGTSANRFPIPEYGSAQNVKAAVRGGGIDGSTQTYQYDSTSFFTEALSQNSNYLGSSIQLEYPDNILAINQEYIEPETLKKIDATDLSGDASLGVYDPVSIQTLFLELINAINSNNHLVFGFDVLSDEIAHHGGTVNSKKYEYALGMENQYVKALQDLLAKRETELSEKGMFVLFTDHGRDKAFDGQHHSLDTNSLRAGFYTNQEQEQIEQGINKPIDSDQRGLNDLKSIITGYLAQN